MAFATSEDTKIRSMLGPVERESTGATSADAEILYSQHYAEMRRLKRSGELDKELEKKKEEQRDLRAFIDRNLKGLIEEDVRKGWGLIEPVEDKESPAQPQEEIWSYRKRAGN